MASGVVVVVLLTHPPPWRPTYPLRSLSLTSPSSLHYRRSWSAAGYRRWDSNAEPGRSQRFGFDFRGKRDEDEDYEEDDEEKEFYGSKGKKRRWWSDESPEMEEGPGGILEEAIDALWILKVTNFTLHFYFCSIMRKIVYVCIGL